MITNSHIIQLTDLKSHHLLSLFQLSNIKKYSPTIINPQVKFQSSIYELSNVSMKKIILWTVSFSLFNFILWIKDRVKQIISFSFFFKEFRLFGIFVSVNFYLIPIDMPKVLFID